MDIEVLRTFVETVRHGSFSQAARALSLSQPGISRRIRKLERELGTELLNRTGGVFTPTRRGLDFLHFAQGVLKEYGTLLTALGDDEPICGTLHIAASTTPGEHLLPDLLARFLQRHLEITASLHVMDSATVAACVEENHCDVGFLGRLPRRGVLSQWQVDEDEIVLAAATTHPFAQEKEVELERLEGQAFVHRQEGSGTRESVYEILETNGRRLPPHRTVMEMSSVHSQLSAIAAGHGIGFVSRLAAEKSSRDQIAILRLTGLTLKRNLYMIYHADRNDRPFVAFTRFVQERGHSDDATPNRMRG